MLTGEPAKMACRRRGRWTPCLFDDLRATDLASGAKPILRRRAGAIVNVEVDDPGTFRGFDTPEAYAGLK